MTDNKWKPGQPGAASPWTKKFDKPASRDERPAPRDERNARPARREERSDRPAARDRYESREQRPAPRSERAEPREQRPSPGRREASVPLAESREETRVSRPSGEMRLYGINACLAAFAKRADDLRKVYLTEARIPALKAVLAWCVKNRLGYRVVEDADLDKLTGSRHHEGVCFEMRRTPPLALSELLAANPPAPAPSLLIWLDGVGNPHNLGALLRSAAHFGVGGVVVPAASSLDLSGAAARVAEGGAEAVALARVEDERSALQELRAAGYSIAATVPRDGVALYKAKLASRLVLVFGAEGEGMSQALIEAADERLMIPGSGVVDSLNIAASAAVMLGEYWRQTRVVSAG